MIFLEKGVASEEIGLKLKLGLRSELLIRVQTSCTAQMNKILPSVNAKIFAQIYTYNSTLDDFVVITFYPLSPTHHD